MTVANKYLDVARRGAPHVLLVLLLGVFLWTGVIGLNFGFHWDEGLALDEIARPLETGVFLPGSYNYASMVFDIGTIALLPQTIPFLFKAGKETYPKYSQPYEEIVPKAKAEPLVHFVKGKVFQLRLRSILLGIVSLTGLWVFVAVRACRRSGWEALFAAAVILTSWELAYHSRWIAPDAIQMQFAALWLMLFAFALNSGAHTMTWLRLSSAAAGLAAGTKYQGAILVLPVIIDTFLVVRASNLRWGANAKQILGNAGIFFIVFLITTPGFILDPLSFWQSVRHIGHQYSTGHYGYTVGAFGEHGVLLLAYLSCVLCSPWLIPAIVIFLVALLGLGAIWKRYPKQALLLLCAPAAYVLFAISFRVMMARNYLLLAPFIALFAGRGAYFIWQQLSSSIWIQRAVVFCFVGVFAANAAFLWIAAKTIPPHLVERGKDIAAYLEKHPEHRFYLSPATTELLANQNVTASNATSDPAVADQYVFHSDEVDRTRFSCNRPRQYRQISGRLEVNVNYYPDWQGQGRVLDLSMKRARELGILLLQ